MSANAVRLAVECFHAYLWKMCQVSDTTLLVTDEPDTAAGRAVVEPDMAVAVVEAKSSMLDTPSSTNTVAIGKGNVRSIGIETVASI